MSDLSVIVDFTMPATKEPKEILILDKSNWGVAYELPAYLSVRPPGFTNWINLSFAKKTYTFLNSSNLGLSCITADCTETVLDDLEDGVWEIWLRSSYENLDKKRYYLKDDQLRTEIDLLRISLFETQGFSYNQNIPLLKDLNIVENLLADAHALVRQGRNKDSMKRYSEACKLVEKYKNCKDCL